VIPKECRRLIEVDFPIAEVSRHSAREKSIRHGRPSTLHPWWARRPVAARPAASIGWSLFAPGEPPFLEEVKRAGGRQVYEVDKLNLDYDLTSIAPRSGKRSLIGVKGLRDATGRMLLTPNEQWVANGRWDCCWLYVVAHRRDEPRLHEVTRVHRHWLKMEPDVGAYAGKRERCSYEGKGCLDVLEDK